MKLPVLSTVALSLSLCSIVSLPARAQEPPPGPPPSPNSVGAGPAPGAFGAQGQLVISTDIPLGTTTPGLSLIHESQSMNGPSTTAFSIAPSADYFVAPNVSVGGGVGVSRDSGSDGFIVSGLTVTTIAVTARVGYNLPLSNAFSLWPRLGLGYGHVSISGDNGASASGYVVPLTIFVPVLWHPTDHFFVGLGPVLVTDLISKEEGNDTPKTTDIGIQAALGGYFNL